VCLSDGCTNPPASCKALHAAYPNLLSGPYTIAPVNGSPMTEYCDLTTDSGGWTRCLSGEGDNTNTYYKRLLDYSIGPGGRVTGRVALADFQSSCNRPAATEYRIQTFLDGTNYVSARFNGGANTFSSTSNIDFVVTANTGSISSPGISFNGAGSCCNYGSKAFYGTPWFFDGLSSAGYGFLWVAGSGGSRAALEYGSWQSLGGPNYTSLAMTLWFRDP
jgi:hypothetical protein